MWQHRFVYGSIDLYVAGTEISSRTTGLKKLNNFRLIKCYQRSHPLKPKHNYVKKEFTKTNINQDCHSPPGFESHVRKTCVHWLPRRGYLSLYVQANQMDLDSPRTSSGQSATEQARPHG